MERFKNILKQAIAAKAMRLKFVVGAAPDIISMEGPKVLDKELPIDPQYYQMLLATLFPKTDHEAIKRGEPVRGFIQAPPVGRLLLLAHDFTKGSLKVYFPPSGEAMFIKAWEEVKAAAAAKAAPTPPAVGETSPSNIKAPIPFNVDPESVSSEMVAVSPEKSSDLATPKPGPIAAPVEKSAPVLEAAEPLTALPKDVFKFTPSVQATRAEPAKSPEIAATAMMPVFTPNIATPPAEDSEPSKPNFGLSQASIASKVTEMPQLSPTPRHSGGPAPIDKILHLMVERKASDVHLTTNQPAILRVDGDITRIDARLISPAEMESYFQPITPEDNMREFLGSNDTDFAYEVKGLGRFRVNLFRDREGVGMVLRHIPSKILTVQDLKLPPAITQFCNLSKGLVVVTGPTGSGKSTTLAAMIDLLNKNRHDHILTIEDPIEFVHPQQNCLVNQREVSKHTKSFARALKAALREDPDIILIGEMRDLETVAIAIETAETGHLVFGTLHTTSAVSTVDRIIDQFPADRQGQIRQMLSSSLKGVVAQSLLKKKTGGRVAAHEILVVTDPVSAMIRGGNNHMIENHMTSQRADGNEMLNDCLAKLVLGDIVAPEEAFLKAVKKKELYQTLKQRGANVTAIETLMGIAPPPEKADPKKSA